MGTPVIPKAETLEDGRRRVTVPIEDADLRVCQLADILLETRMKALQVDLQDLKALEQGARSDALKDIQAVLSKYSIEPPEGSHLRFDREAGAVIWEMEAEAVEPEDEELRALEEAVEREEAELREEQALEAMDDVCDAEEPVEIVAEEAVEALDE